MLLKEFKTKYEYMLGPEIGVKDPYDLPQGKAIFYVTVRSGSKLADERAVTSAGIGLIVYSQPGYCEILGLTHGGSAKIIAINKIGLCDTHFLFWVNPINAGDPNFNRIDWFRE